MKRPPSVIPKSAGKRRTRFNCFC